MGYPKIHFIFKPFAIGLFTTIVVISAVFITLNYYQISKREKILLKNKADEYIDIITSALEVPLWDIDRENIKNICTYYFQNELITMVCLAGVSGENLYEKKKRVETKKRDLINRSRNIYYNNEFIGNIQITVAQQQSDKFSKQLLVSSISALFISIAGLIVATGMVERRTKELETTNRSLQKEIAERKKTQEMMIQSEKMLSEGGLAAGMAHEINNPLAGIMQNAQVAVIRLTKSMPVNDKAALEAGTTISAIKDYIERREIIQLLDNIHKAGSNAAKIVENMLSFARKGDSSKSNHNAAELFRKTLALAESDYDLKKKYDFKQIKIVNEFNPDFPDVLCEEQQKSAGIFKYK